MSLNFDTSKIENKEILKEMLGSREVWSQETQSMVFATMYLGVPKIADETAGEFYRRYRMYATAQGQPQPGFITENLVRQYIGLTTNASKITNAAFNKVLLDLLQVAADTQLTNERALLLDPNAITLI